MLDTIAPATRVDLVRLRVRVKARVRVMVDSGTVSRIRKDQD